MPQTQAVLRVQQSIPAAVLPPHGPKSPESHQRPSKQQQGDVGRLPTSSFGLWGERGTKLGGGSDSFCKELVGKTKHPMVCSFYIFL